MSTLLVKTSSLAKKSRGEKSIFDYLEDPRATSTLPSLQSVLAELENLTQKSNIRLDEVTKLVPVDQGMSLRVLRMANSVYYAPTQPILDVQDAILYIGLNTFRGAVVSTRCIEKTCHIRQSTLDWKDFWTHGASVGHLTVELASHLKVCDLGLESFYLMGLLHDIGKVVLAHLMPGKFEEIYVQAALEKKAPAALESKRSASSTAISARGTSRSRASRWPCAKRCAFTTATWSGKKRMRATRWWSNSPTSWRGIINSAIPARDGHGRSLRLRTMAGLPPNNVTPGWWKATTSTARWWRGSRRSLTQSARSSFKTLKPRKQ